MAESPRTVFAGEKREREEDEEDGGMENHTSGFTMWYLETVSGRRTNRRDWQGRTEAMKEDRT
jgi:hypothetical protein